MRLLAFLILLFVSSTAFGQYTTVLFDAESQTFESGTPLPAEQYMIITGFVEDTIEMISIDFTRSNSSSNTSHYTNYWKRTPGTTPILFEIPVNFALRGNRRYDVNFEYYQKVDSSEITTLQNSIKLLLSDFFGNNITKQKGKVKLLKNEKLLVQELNGIINDTTKTYIHKITNNFKGFSAHLTDKLTSIKGKKVKNISDLDNLMQSVYKIAEEEVLLFVNEDLLILTNQVLIKQYPVEKTPNIVSINAGYGLTLPKNYDGIANSSSPFIGISVPFSNRQYTPNFLKNTAFSFGISLKNYKDKDGNTVTGPIIKRPIYFALGYKVFKVVRLNVGGHLLSVDIDGEAAPLENLKFDPFFGISAEFDIWIGFGRKKKKL